MPTKYTETQLKRRPDLYYQCTQCSDIKQRSKRDRESIKAGMSGPQSKRCATCTRADPEYYAHGTARMYRKGCLCTECRSAGSARTEQTRLNYEARTGEPYQIKTVDHTYRRVCAGWDCTQVFETPYKKIRFCSRSCGQLTWRREERLQRTSPVLYDPEFAEIQQNRIDSGLHDYPGLERGAWIDHARRHELYELHGWTCQECGVLCSRRTSNDGLPDISLDHLLSRHRWPKGHHLMHDDLNLTVLCYSCNSRKSDSFTPRSWPSLLVLIGELSPEEARTLRRNKIIRSKERRTLNDSTDTQDSATRWGEV